MYLRRGSALVTLELGPIVAATDSGATKTGTRCVPYLQQGLQTAQSRLARTRVGRMVRCVAVPLLKWSASRQRAAVVSRELACTPFRAGGRPEGGRGSCVAHRPPRLPALVRSGALALVSNKPANNGPFGCVRQEA